jgi:molybdopterin-guanine dinucleotide biosynthesis protein A
LGVSKVLLSVDGRSLLLGLLDKLGAVFQEVLLVTRDEPNPAEGEVFREAENMGGVRVVRDVYPNKGPLGGIHASLYHASSPLVFVTACDMPFPSLPLALALLVKARGREAAVPRVGGYLEPLFAVYAAKAASKAREFLDKGVLQVSRFIESLDAYYMEEDEVTRYDPQRISFRNINSWEDLESLRRIWDLEAPKDLPTIACFPETTSYGASDIPGLLRIDEPHWSAGGGEEAASELHQQEEQAERHEEHPGRHL